MKYILTLDSYMRVDSNKIIQLEPQPEYIEPKYWIEYNLLKDNSWIQRGFHLIEMANNCYKKLKVLGYKPTKKYA